MSTVCGVRRRRRRYNKIHKAVCEENSLTIALFISLVNLDLFKIIMKVERSINLAYSAVETFPESKIHITNELIHNPMVNDRLHTKNVNFIKKDEDNFIQNRTTKDKIMLTPKGKGSYVMNVEFPG